MGTDRHRPGIEFTDLNALAPSQIGNGLAMPLSKLRISGLVPNALCLVPLSLDPVSRAMLSSGRSTGCSRGLSTPLWARECQRRETPKSPPVASEGLGDRVRPIRRRDKDLDKGGNYQGTQGGEASPG
jgi:hypothetical protein